MPKILPTHETWQAIQMNANPVIQVVRYPGIRCLRSKDRCLMAKRIKGKCLSNVYICASLINIR